MRGRIDEDELDRRLEAVRVMDRMLADDGMVLARFWIHAPRDEHRRRFAAGKKHPEWKWRLDATDRAILERYEEVVPLADRCVAATDAPHAPWRIVSSMDDHARDLTVGESLLERLEFGLREAATLRGRPPVASPPGPALPAGGGRLAELDQSAHLPKDAYVERKGVLQARLARRMRQLADAGQSAVVVIEGPDAAGKGGAIRRVVAALPATMERVVRIGAPTDEEADRHYLWRFWRPLPPAGHLLIFDRSWYGRVLVERVEGYAREAAWRRAYDEINAFEAQLLGHGMALVKLWLHIDREEQARRFEAREATGWKRHKITEADWRARERWDDYVAAAEEMFARTSTKAAPWTIVPADDKRYARVQVLDTITRTLKRSLWKDRRRRRRT
jgi:polyphosphate kinase 2 (PPK2 family)